MIDHVSNGTVFAAIATGAVIFWLDSRTDPVGSTGRRRQISLFDYDRDTAPASTAPTAAPTAGASAPVHQQPDAAPTSPPADPRP